MFVANHFTRSETFFVPYLIYRNTGRQVRCLADAGLYHGALGRFLESVGTISTKNPKRDNIILKDLIGGEYDWMIYPEGSMVKSKEIKNEQGFVSYTPYRVGHVRTGSAVLALKSEIFREDMVEAFEINKLEALRDLEEKFGLTYRDNFKDINTYIVPLNITYYPLRPGRNGIQKLVNRLVKKIPRQIAEELEIEGNLLLEADINIHFGKAINLGEYVKNVRSLIAPLPIIKDETKTNLILRYLKTRLTNNFMEQVYGNIQVNFDHIFAASLNYFKQDIIEIGQLKRVIYLSAVMIQKSQKYRLNSSLFEENLFKIFIDEDCEIFDGVFALALKQGLIKQLDDKTIKIEKRFFQQDVDFHEIRRENSLKVIFNEFSLLDFANEIVKRNVKMPDDLLRHRVFEEIKKRDLEIFESDYNIYFDKDFSKDKEVGSPFFLNSRAKVSSRVRRTGILICHGYKSAPQEVAALAYYLNGFGFKIYATRLKGHGTAPINLKNVTWHDWYNSMQRGYAALYNICSKVVIIGFSTGGLLSLVSAAKKANHKSKLEAIVSINAAIKLLDIRARMVPGINIWNEMLEKLHIEKGRFEYVDDKPENPHINYSRNYLKGVEQLEKLMHVCEDSLKKIQTDSLIIQGDKDQVVSPVSGKIIYEKLGAKNKFLTGLDFANHVIINGERKEEVFEVIREFLYKLKLL